MIPRIREDVEILTLGGPRVPGSRAHAAARAYLLRRVQELGLEPYADGTFELRRRLGLARAWLGSPEIVNLVARLPGARAGAEPVLLAAHYDTVDGCPGADDNAAAIAIALATAHSLRSRALERPVVFAFFDGEEPPYFLTSEMGSVRFYESQRREPVHAAVVLDLVGHAVPVPGLENALFLTGMESDPGLPAVLAASAPGSGLRIVPALNRYVGDLSDHHVFRVNRRPYLFLTCGRWEHYHQPTDTPDRLDYQKIEAIAGFVTRLVESLAGAPLAGPFEGYDSTPAELAFARAALGAFADAAGLKLERREDMDALAELMLGEYCL